jgi:hypothetical protein
MAVFFQKISDDQFNLESDFVVKESKNMNLIIGIFFLVFSLATFQMSVLMGCLTLFFAVGTLARSAKNITVMTINKTGFYHYGELITDWDHFISEEFIDGLSRRGQDQCFLLIKYYKDGESGYFGRKIPFTDTQDKSEEEIMAAIKFYYTNSQKAIQ